MTKFNFGKVFGLAAAAVAVFVFAGCEDVAGVVSAKTLTGTVTIKGGETPQVGSELEAEVATSATGVLAYAWQRQQDEDDSWITIQGANDIGYTPDASDAGHYLRVVVTANGYRGALDAESDGKVTNSGTGGSGGGSEGSNSEGENEGGSGEGGSGGSGENEGGELGSGNGETEGDVRLLIKDGNNEVAVTDIYEDSLSGALDYIANYAQEGDTYIVELAADQAIPAVELKKANIVLRGHGSERKITWDSEATGTGVRGGLFQLNGNNAKLTLGQNITLDGQNSYIIDSANSAAMVALSSGELVMENGSKITRCKVMSLPPVNIGKGCTFTMNGGIITSSSSYAVYMATTGGTFVMNKDAEISGNAGDGVYATTGTIDINGGTIKDNGGYGIGGSTGSKTVNINGGTITGNGKGIAMGAGTLNITNHQTITTTIKNKSTNYNEGIDFFGGTMSIDGTVSIADIIKLATSGSDCTTITVGNNFALADNTSHILINLSGTKSNVNKYWGKEERVFLKGDGLNITESMLSLFIGSGTYNSSKPELMPGNIELSVKNNAGYAKFVAQQ